MLCYKDKTFCPYYNRCILGKYCTWPLTTKVINDAKKVGLPVLRFMDKPSCFKEKKLKGYINKGLYIEETQFVSKESFDSIPTNKDKESTT